MTQEEILNARRQDHVLATVDGGLSYSCRPTPEVVVEVNVDGARSWLDVCEGQDEQISIRLCKELENGSGRRGADEHLKAHVVEFGGLNAVELGDFVALDPKMDPLTNVLQLAEVPKVLMETNELECQSIKTWNDLVGLAAFCRKRGEICQITGIFSLLRCLHKHSFHQLSYFLVQFKGAFKNEKVGFFSRRLEIWKCLYGFVKLV
jgi:hypothetical protein